MKNFTTEHTQTVMESVFVERRRQVQLGRAGKIPHPCEDPLTHWGYKIGVLGEEYGEVCKEVIETPPEQFVGPKAYAECVQVAAVAIACAESLIAQGAFGPRHFSHIDEGATKAYNPHDAVGIKERPGVEYSNMEQAEPLPDTGYYIVFDGPPGPEAGRFIETEDGFGRGIGPNNTGARWQEIDGRWLLGPFGRYQPKTETYIGIPPEDEGGKEHYGVMMRAFALYEERNEKYKDVWKSYGWRGCLMHLRTEVLRAWRVWWGADPDHGNVDAKAVDGLLDLINYAVFTIRNIEHGNRDGEWTY